MEEIKVGDFVHLKSGGPGYGYRVQTYEFVAGDVVCSKAGGMLMTVEKVEDDEVSCVYFNGNGKPLRAKANVTDLDKWVRA